MGGFWILLPIESEDTCWGGRGYMLGRQRKHVGAAVELPTRQNQVLG